MCHYSNMGSSPGLAVAATGSFPSPAQDYYEGRLDLDRHLIRNPAATFVLRVRGDGLRSAGILDGDELIVDRSLELCPGRTVVVVLVPVVRYWGPPPLPVCTGIWSPKLIVSERSPPGLLLSV